MSMTRLFLCGVLLLGLIAQASEAFLEEETLNLPTNGREVATRQPLEEFARYDLFLRTPYDARVLWYKRRNYSYALLLDGRYESNDNMVSAWKRDGEMHELKFQILGRGGPLKLRVESDLSADLPTASVKIVRVRVPQPPPAPPAPPPPPVPEIVPAEPTAAGDVLARATFPLPMGAGPGVQTALPLQDGRMYYIRIRADRDLRRLWNTRRNEYRVQINGQALNTMSIVSPWDLGREIYEAVFAVRGSDRPIVMQLTDDVSEVIPEAHVEIFPAPAPIPAPDYSSLWRMLKLAGLVVLVLVLIAIVLICVLTWCADQEARRQRARLRQEEAEAARRALEREAIQAQARRVEAKARVWINREHEEPWFRDADFCHSYAKEEHEDILAHLKDEWIKDRRTVTDDGELTRYLRQYAPQVFEWLEARLHVIDLAKRASIDALREETPPKQTPEEWEARQAAHAQRMADRDYQAAELAILQALEHKLRMKQLHDRLLAKHPGHASEISKLFKEYAVFTSAPPPQPEKDAPVPAGPPPAPMGPEIL